MKMLIVLLLAVAALLLFAIAASAATLRFEWDPGNPDEELLRTDLYWSTNVDGPYSVLASTTNGVQTNLVVTNALYGRAFYYVVAVNFWTNSEPSNTVKTPALPTPIQGVKLSLLSTDSVRYVLSLATARRPLPPRP